MGHAFKNPTTGLASAIKLLVLASTSWAARGGATALNPTPLPGSVALGPQDLVRVTVMRPGLLRLQTRPTTTYPWDDRPSLQVHSVTLTLNLALTLTLTLTLTHTASLALVHPHSHLHPCPHPHSPRQREE